MYKTRSVQAGLRLVYTLRITRPTCVTRTSHHIPTDPLTHLELSGMCYRITNVSINVTTHRGSHTENG